MKIVKRFLLITFLSAPLFLLPKQSHAGIIGDILHALFGNNQNGQGQNGQGQHGNHKDPATANSVPLNGETVLLVMAGLGLGTGMLLRAKSRNLEIASNNLEIASNNLEIAFQNGEVASA